VGYDVAAKMRNGRQKEKGPARVIRPGPATGVADAEIA
jgi:hypothetical protein